MRELRTATTLAEQGITEARLRWALDTGRWTLIIRGVYGRGAAPPSKLDVARATALVTQGVCHGFVAGELLTFDKVTASTPEVWVPRSCRSERAGVKRRASMPADTVDVAQVRCTNAADTLLELANRLGDDEWEQALEFCLRKGHVTPELVGSWRNRRIRRVIGNRGGLQLPHTDSLLETLAIQLIRTDPTLPTPTRQLRIFDPMSERFIGRVDLCWPALGIFLELDGQQHRDQPVYDAARQNKVTAATRWLCVRLTWDQVTKWPEATLRDLRPLLSPNCLVS
ncbi:MAG: hypothetical protein QOG90_984 [Actinomycetota bacterium]|jgi:hypothetical protein